MNGWKLEDVWNMDSDDYDELVTWLTDQADRAKYGDSVDLDALTEAERAKTMKELNG